MYTLRRARPDDQETIRCIIRQVRINPMGLAWSRFIVAEQDGQTVGIGQIKPHNDGTRELASIAVLPEMQGQGIGSAVIRALMQDATPPLYLTCRSTLETYYQQFGFKKLSTAEMPPYFRRLSRLAALLFRSTCRPVTLAVMRWDGEEAR